MALSEQERKLLEQLEASLMADDPKLADTLSGSSQIRIHRRRAAIAGLGFVAGVIVLMVGVQIHPALSVGGFLLMLASTLIGINSWQRVGNDDEPAKPRSSRPTSRPGPSASVDPSSDFMNKLEERWRRRQQGDL